jgi:Fic family protein
MDAMSFDRNRPYDELPDLPPEGVETKAVLKAVIRARVAVERLREAGGKIPNQHLVLQTLGLREAKASSEIENIVTTSDEVFKAPAVDTKDDYARSTPGAKEVYRYRDALYHGLNRLKRDSHPLDTVLMEELFRIVKQTGAEDGVRRRGVFIGSAKFGPVYTPPEGHELLTGKLASLGAFIHAAPGTPAAELDPLVRVALAHYQFEAIHPFADGNGRVGRILAVLMMIAEGLIDEPVIYLSGVILDGKFEYYQRLMAVTEKGEWEAWILYFLNAIEKSAEDATGVIRNIGLVIEFFAERLRTTHPGIYSRELVELCFRKAYLRPEDIEKAGIAGKTQSYDYLRRLVESGLLGEEKSGNRTLYVNRRLLAEVGE